MNTRKYRKWECTELPSGVNNRIVWAVLEIHVLYMKQQYRKKTIQRMFVNPENKKRSELVNQK